jgi:Flp pilus assembly protein TadD
MLNGVGRTDEAISWLQARAAETGDSYARWQAAELLANIGHVDEAVALSKRGAESSDTEALHQMARLLGDAGRVEHAVDLYQRAAQSGGHSP